MASPHRSVSSGYAALDVLLPGQQGWSSGLTELLSDGMGIGELSLLMPCLVRAQQAQPIVWIDPPWVPHAPMLQRAGIHLARLVIVRPAGFKDALWAAERTLASGTCAAVVLWSRERLAHTPLQRLHWAAVRGRTLAFLHRDGACQIQPSPAPVRVRLEGGNPGFVQVTIFKRRGAMAAAPLQLPLAGWQTLCVDAGQAHARVHRHAIRPLTSPQPVWLNETAHVPLAERRYPAPDR